MIDSTGKPVGAAAGTSSDGPTQDLVPLAEVLRLLDTSGLGFVLHTHHPLTHLEYGASVPADPWAVNARQECPEIVMEERI